MCVNENTSHGTSVEISEGNEAQSAVQAPFIVNIEDVRYEIISRILSRVRTKALRL